MSGSLSITKPTLTNGFQLHFEVQNEAQLKEIELEKAALMMFLRKELNNYSVQLSLEKSIVPIKTRPYTSEEKLAALEESNPNITLLKNNDCRRIPKNLRPKITTYLLSPKRFDKTKFARCRRNCI
jgi:hypothetical protein